ncbi:HlyD family secretion protein [Pseudoalteromonas phenolica]|uniref:Efflux transporter, RND family, MFP subunit n=1 Tax=Pseudoalteromonas phenolica TaxID=161398 RepID=A0A0S2K7M0_9GAMM|nr:HlyD family efflux transporter periplasmic adaptor subunit [Pseudoalteromonas phenolica]ALO44184.1 Efflux transporter, RND family, MFP subunit [Pseudoalteromonas phenolica]MBE0357176.1 hypothetical protein [Pseudoalteromonas phenolica O-BC30]
MDVVVKPKKNTKRHLSILAFVCLLLGGCIWLFLQPSHAEQIQANEIWSAKVEQGTLNLEVSGFGRLKSKKPRLLTAKSQATVDEIVLKPGAEVTPESVILKLSDPNITQSVRDAKRAYIDSQNQRIQTDINQKRELLAQQAELARIQADLESAELEANAQSQLVSKGIVSNIDYQRTKLQVRQLTRRLEIETARITQLEALHAANLKIADSNILAQQEALGLVQQQLDSLTVKAGIYGVVQSLSVELGQAVNLGEQLALVGSTTDLYALLNVPQSKMQSIQLAQAVIINTRRGEISGEVIRIDPVINNGNIQVEVALNGALTDNARPELNIEGTIAVGQLANALFIKKPVNVKAFSNSTLFKLTDNGSAIATPIQFGAATDEQIQILAGAQAHEQFILNDMTRWQAHTHIAIVK